ncbi:uncharacterized protein LOC116199062 isoform X2 [Punica granatum]|uniref:Uncharacterized protein LOC116199062 isoform X2 n=1 Tax=Punica granatum TaxID=22663 RepID=A0A6P8D0Y2_PUNGR|nr:uncharacterized protein LOC116199062 isoform X2 [Punica granatum]
MATHGNGQKKGFSIMAFSKVSNIAGNYALKPEPAAPAPAATSKSRSWLLMRKSSSRSCAPEINRVNSEKRISFSKEEAEWKGEGGGGGGVVIAEGRRSVSQVETNLASVVAFLQVKVMVSDMPGFMQVHAFRCARRTYDSLEKFSSRHMAYNMKKRHIRPSFVGNPSQSIAICQDISFSPYYYCFLFFL